MLSDTARLKLKHPNLADTADFNLSVSISNLKIGKGDNVLFHMSKRKQMSVNCAGR